MLKIPHCGNTSTITGTHKMTPSYTFIPSTDFINNLAFDYVETYSFQRGSEYELQEKIFVEEYDKLKSRKSKQNDLTIEEEKRLSFLDKLCGSTQYLLDNSNQFHYSAKKTNTFSSTNSNVELLKDILRTEINDVPAWMCAPIYRDGFVFYDNQDKIVSVLNVCLSCQYMETTKFNHINGDYITYDLLKRFFIDIGHDVEDPEHYVLDDINKLKSKNKK
ncbi:hypothetical protein [Flectobacillus roseus]|uniref:Uncharacterized protein n=1 Tax=Flectobacillus roseus TaxID=502259 RepID=A0ABT6YFH3_9BACT|nr:hypothetical protein [Flectobacillus roseus]MDI9862334.1 hypothetical protein [Flectobacillus roseus]